MNYSEIIREKDPITYKIIDNAFRKNKISHAYLFSAPLKQECDDEYKFLVQKLISSDSLRNPDVYSDLILIDGAKSLIKKEEVIQAIQKLQETTLDISGKKILVIKNIENSNKQSINSLLKFIEEPTKDTYIIMTTNKLSSVLPTIKSRSQIISVKPMNIDKLTQELIKLNVSSKYARLLALVFNSKENSLKNNNDHFFNLVNESTNLLRNALDNPNSIITDGHSLVKKDSFDISISILKELIMDIWKFDQSLTLSFETNVHLYEKYLLTNFNFARAIRLLNQFIIDRKYHLNFDLQRNNLFIQMKECYE